MKPRQSLLIQGESSLTVNPTEQAKIVAEHFRSTFFKKTPNQCIPMRVPFTTIKTCRAVNKMKTNKSPGYDEISIELIKHAHSMLDNSNLHV